MATPFVAIPPLAPQLPPLAPQLPPLAPQLPPVAPQLPDLCNVPLVKTACGVVGAAKSAAGAAIQVVKFTEDPLGYIATKMQSASSELAKTVLPAMNKLTRPDLSKDFFLSAYKISFALAIFVFVAFLGWNFVLLSRRRISGDEVIDTLAFYTPLFFGSVIFGPLIGTMLLDLTGALTDSLSAWGVGSVTDTTNQLQGAITAGSPEKITGGSVVAIIFFFCLILALVLCFVVLLVMLVTLYLTGAILPLSLVWLVQPRQRSKGIKVAMVWVSILFSHVLLFLMLGVAFHLVAGLTTTFDDPGLTILAHLAVAVIALAMATLSPVLLLKFAPVGPSSANVGGPALSTPGTGSSAGTSYPQSGSDSQTAQLSRETVSSSGGGSGGNSSGDGSNGGGGSGSRGSGSGGGDGGEPTGGGGGGGLVGRLTQQQARTSGGSGGKSESGAGTGNGSGAAPSPAGVGTGGAGPATGGSPLGASPGGGSSPVGAGAASSGTGSGAGASAAEAGGAAETAGVAADATGVGLPVGLALGAAGMAASVGSRTAQMAQAGGDQASEHMAHGDNTGEGSDANTHTGW